MATQTPKMPNYGNLADQIKSYVDSIEDFNKEVFGLDIYTNANLYKKGMYDPIINNISNFGVSLAGDRNSFGLLDYIDQTINTIDKSIFKNNMSFDLQINNIISGLSAFGESYDVIQLYIGDIANRFEDKTDLIKKITGDGVEKILENIYNIYEKLNYNLLNIPNGVKILDNQFETLIDNLISFTVSFDTLKNTIWGSMEFLIIDPSEVVEFKYNDILDNTIKSIFNIYNKLNYNQLNAQKGIKISDNQFGNIINNLNNFSLSLLSLKNHLNNNIHTLNGEVGESVTKLYINDINNICDVLDGVMNIYNKINDNSLNVVENMSFEKSFDDIIIKLNNFSVYYNELKLHVDKCVENISSSSTDDNSVKALKITTNMPILKDMLSSIINNTSEIATIINDAGDLATDVEFFKSKFDNIGTISNSISILLKAVDGIKLKHVFFAKTKIQTGFNLLKAAAISSIDLNNIINGYKFETVTTPGSDEIGVKGEPGYQAKSNPKVTVKAVAVMEDITTVINSLKSIMSSALADENFDRDIDKVYKNLPKFENVMIDVLKKINNLSDTMGNGVDFKKFESMSKPFELVKTILELADAKLGIKEIAKIHIKTEIMLNILVKIYNKYSKAFNNFDLGNLTLLSKSVEYFNNAIKTANDIVAAVIKGAGTNIASLLISLNMLRFKLHLLKSVYNVLNKFALYIINNDQLSNLENSVTRFNEYLKMFLKIDTKSIDNINNSISDLIKLTINFIKLKIITSIFKSNNGLDNIIVFVVGVGEILVSVQEKMIDTNLDYKNISESIVDINNIIGILLDISKTYLWFVVISKLVNPTVVTNFVTTILDNMSLILQKIDDIDVSDNIKKLDKISSVLTNSMLHLALFGVVAVLTGPVVLLGLMLFEVMLDPISVITEKLSEMDDIEDAARSLLIISASFLLFTASMAMISQIAITGNIFLGMIVLGMTVAIAVSAMLVINKIDKDITNGAKALLIISGAFTLFVVTIALLSTVLIEWNIIGGMLSLLTVVGIAVGAMYLISKFNSDIVKGALSMLIISGSFILFTVSLIMMNNLLDNWEGVLMGVIGLSVIVGACVALLMFIGNGTVMTNIFMGSLALLLVSASLTIAAISLLAVAKTTEEIHWGWLLAGIASMTLVMTAVAGIGVLMIGGGILLIGAATAGMLLASGGLMVMGVTMQAISSMQLDSDRVVENILAINGGITLFIKTLPGIIPLTLAMLKVPQILALSLAIMSIGTAVSMIANLRMATGFDKDGNPTSYRQLNKSDFEKAAENTEIIIDTMFRALMNVYNNNTNIKTALEGKGLFGTSPIGKLIRFTRRLGGAISGVARGVADMANLRVADKWDKKGNPISYRQLNEGDFTLASTNIGKIITNMFNALLPLAQDENIKEAIKGRMNRSTFGKILNTVSKMGEAISNIASGIQDFANMRVANAWDKNGKPTSYLIMSDTVLTQAKDNIVTVVTSMIKSLTPLTKDKDIAEAMKGGGAFGFGEGKLSKIMGVVAGIGASLTDIASNIVSYATLSFKDVKGTMVTLKPTQITDAKNNINSIFSAVLKGYASIDKDTIEDARKKIKMIKKADLSSINSSFIDPITKLTAENTEFYNKSVEYTGKLITTVNSVDVSKLKATKELIDSVTKLTKELNENFDKMSETLGGKLVKAIEELNKVLGGMGDMDVNTSINTTTSSNNNSISTPTPQKSISTDDMLKINSTLNSIKNILSGMEDEGMKVKGPVKLVESY